MFDSVKQIAGSSAGALTAVGVGCGFDAEALKTFTATIEKGLMSALLTSLVNIPMPTPPDAETSKKEPTRFADGGLAMNLPCSVFIPPAGTASNVRIEDAQSKTLSFVFDEEGKGMQAQSIPQPDGPDWKFWVAGVLFGATTGSPFSSGNLYYKVAAEQKTLGTLGNVMVVGHGTLGTISFDASPDELVVADAMAEAQAEEFVRQHKHEACAIKVNTAGEAFDIMSPDEKQVFLQQYAEIKPEDKSNFMNELYALITEPQH